MDRFGPTVGDRATAMFIPAKVALPTNFIPAIVAWLMMTPMSATLLHAQEAPQRPLLTAATNEPFASIAGVRALTGGALLVSDTKQQVVWRIGTGGQRSAVRDSLLRAPGGLIALGGDTTLVFDRLGRRLLMITPDGRVSPASETLRAPDMTRSLVADLSSDAFTANARGDVIFALRSPGATQPTVRRRDVSGRLDSLTALQNTSIRLRNDQGQSFTLPSPFAPVDTWAAAPNGDVIVVRGFPYRVDRITPDGTVRHGNVRVDEGPPVLQVDRDAYRQTVNEMLASVGIPASLLPAVPDTAWPKTKAPFAVGAVRVAPDGSVWVHRAGPADATETLIDVFDNAGAWRKALLLPRDSRIVGFGATNVFVAIPDGSAGFGLKSFARP